MWLLCHKRIQCHSNLLKKGTVSNAICEVCSLRLIPKFLDCNRHRCAALTEHRGSTQTSLSPRHPTARVRDTAGACLLAVVEEKKYGGIQRRKAPRSISYWDRAMRQSNGELECPGNEDRGRSMVHAIPNGNGSDLMR
jgi:hypothetical protein